jgi:hypothetical protein
MGSNAATIFDVQPLLADFLNMSQRSACFIDEAIFLVKSKTSGLEVSDHQDFLFIGRRSRGILLFLYSIIKAQESFDLNLIIM